MADSTSYVVWDEITGWRNRPNAQRGLWQVGPDGARRTSRGTDRVAEARVWFFGDSMMNGGTGIGGDETISAYLEDDRTATSNFGTMLYGVDQSYLLLRCQLEGAAPDAIVVGLSDNGIQALDNRYVPFRVPIESAMPYLKPRFVVEDSRLVLLPTPPRSSYADLLGDAKLLGELSATDDYYAAFAKYRRFGVLPISSGLWGGCKKVRAAWRAAAGTSLASPLLVALLETIGREARDAGTAVVFLMLPTRADTEPTRVKRLLPDRYAALVRDLRAAGFPVVDGRDALLRSGRPARELYHPDGIHYRRDGNRLIADSLSPALRAALQASLTSG